MEYLKRINWLMVLAYFILIGAVTPLVVYLTISPIDLSPGIAITLLFGILGSIAYAFHLMGEGRGWKWLAYFEGFMSGLTFWIWLMADDIVHPAIGLSSMFFILAGFVMYISYRRKLSQADRIEGENFRELETGERLDYLSPSERDHAPVSRDRSDYGAR